MLLMVIVGDATLLLMMVVECSATLCPIPTGTDLCVEWLHDYWQTP